MILCRLREMLFIFLSLLAIKSYIHTLFNPHWISLDIHKPHVKASSPTRSNSSTIDTNHIVDYC